MSETEARPEGQVEGTPAPEAIPESMTEKEIEARIETDADFRQKVTSGQIDVGKLLKVPGEAEQTPAGQAADAPATPPEEKDEVFTVKKSELEGQKSIGELLKSWKEKQAHIERLETENLQFRTSSNQTMRKLSELEVRLNGQVDARLKAAEAEAAPAAGAQEDDDLSVYDPKKLREVSKTTKEMADKIKSLESRLAEREQVDNQSAEYRQTIDTLSSFQEAHPELKTKRPFAEINTEYGIFVEKLANLAGAGDKPMQDKLALVGSYLDNKTAEDQQIRAVADRANLKLPEEFETYNTILSIRTAQQRLAHFDPSTNQAIPFTTEEAYNHLVANGKVKVSKPAEVRPAAAQPNDPAERARMLDAAKRQIENSAPDIPPGASGSPASIDNLSYDEQMKLLDTPTEELRSNPAKLKLVNDIMKRLGMKPLNVGA